MLSQVTRHESPQVPLQLRLPADLLGRIDQARASMAVQPSRMAMIRWLLDKGLEAQELQPILRRPT
jgi:hypothetical protein